MCRQMAVCLALGVGLWASISYAAAPKAPEAEIRHEQEVLSVQFSPDGKWIATAAGDALTLWDARNRQQQWSDRVGAPASMAWSPEGDRLALASTDGVVRVWTAADMRQAPVQFRVQQGHLGGMSFSPDGKLLACGGAHLIVSLWDIEKQREIKQFQRQSNWWVGSVGFVGDGRRLLAGGYDGFIRIWDIESGKEVLKLAAPMFTQVAISPDGKTLVSNGDGQRLRVLEAATGRVRQEFGQHGAADFSPLFSPDGRVVAERAKQEQFLRLWDRTSGTALGELEGGGPCAFSADGGWVALGQGGTLCLWRMRDLMPQRAPPPKREADQLESLWRDLGGTDATKAYGAVLALADAPEAPAFARGHIRADRAEAPAGLDKLVAELDDDDFQVREKAQRQIIALGPVVEPILRRALKDASAEVKLRLEQILAELASAGPALAELQALRGIEALELGGTEACAQALLAISKADLPRTTQADAAAAAARLARRFKLARGATTKRG